MSVSALDLIQSLSIVASFLFTIYQIRLAVKTQKMAIVTRISERNDSLLQDIMSSPQIFKEFSKPFDSATQSFFADPRVAIMYRTLNFFDEMLFYYYQGYINKGTWDLYQTTMRRFFGEPFAITFWNSVRGEYNEDLQKCIDKAIAGNSGKA